MATPELLKIVPLSIRRRPQNHQYHAQQRNYQNAKCGAHGCAASPFVPLKGGRRVPGACGAIRGRERTALSLRAVCIRFPIVYGDEHVLTDMVIPRGRGIEWMRDANSIVWGQRLRDWVSSLPLTLLLFGGPHASMSLSYRVEGPVDIDGLKSADRTWQTVSDTTRDF